MQVICHLSLASDIREIAGDYPEDSDSNVERDRPDGAQGRGYCVATTEKITREARSGYTRSDGSSR